MSSSSSPYSNGRFTQSPKMNIIDTEVYRTLDIDSTHRNRVNYPNPNDFVMPTQYPGRGSTNVNAIDPVIGAVPYTGSETKTVGELVTGTSLSGSAIVLDSSEPNIDNFYINSILQIGSSFSTIIGYTGSTHTAVVNPPFGSTPAPATVYYTRYELPIYYGTVSTAVVPSTTTSFALGGGASSSNGAYVNSYVVFITGANAGEYSLITGYTGASHTIILQTPLSSAPTNGSAIEVDNFTEDNAQVLNYATNILGAGSQVAYYEIDLLWVSYPNQTLGVDYGGVLADYPFIYISLYNESSPASNQVLSSNNPHTTNVLFKVPVDNYNGVTYFYTLSNSNTKQVIQFHPDKPLRFTVTLPNGQVASFAEADNMAPLYPNQLLQISCAFSIRRVS